MPHYPPAMRPLGPDAEGQWVRRWLSPEWTRDADAWVADRLGEYGRRISGVPATYRPRFWSVVRCYVSVEGLVWFKENNPGHRHEAGLAATLAELAPDDVVVPIAVDYERSRLLTEDQGPILTHDEVADQAIRRAVVRALARLQCSLLGRLDPVGQGLVELPPRTAGQRVRQVAEAWAGLPKGHPLHHGPAVLAQVDRAADVLDRRTDALSDAVPLDVEINDVYPANIFADRSTGVLRPRFFDFGNAIWAHPFVTLHGFLESVVEWTHVPLSPDHRSQLYDDYLDIWRNHLDADHAVLRRDLHLTECLSPAHRLISWLRLIPYADPAELASRAEIPRTYLNQILARTPPAATVTCGHF